MCQGKDLPKRLDENNRFVTVTTIQSLTSAGGRKLQGVYDLILFDEGHKKGALEWDPAVEDVGVPTILFTATPYRADGRPLNALVIYRYVFAEARRDNPPTLRPLIFRPIDFSLNNMGQAIKTVSQYILSEKARWGSHGQPKVVLRVNNHKEVASFVMAFNRLSGISAVGIHSQFNGNHHKLFNSTSRIPKDANVLIHQNILLEGFDDPNITAVVFTTEVDDGRVFVQQVGRALRWNNSLPPSILQKAAIFCSNKTKAEESWRLFQEFEEDPSGYAYKGHHFTPTLESVEKNFTEHLLLRPSAQIRSLIRPNAKSIKMMAEEIKYWISHQSDLVLRASGIMGGHKQPPAISFLIERHVRPPFIQFHFENRELAVLIFVFGKKHVFVQSSMGRLPKFVKKWPLCSPDTIKHLIPFENAEIQSVQLRNLHDGVGTIRARALWADGADRHIRFSQDGSFAPQTLSWWNKGEECSEMATFTSSRFGSNDHVSFVDFLEWCQNIEYRLLVTHQQAHSLFDSLAERTNDQPGIPFLIRFDLPQECNISDTNNQNVRLISNQLWAEVGPKGIGVLEGGDPPLALPSIRLQIRSAEQAFDVQWDSGSRLKLSFHGEEYDLLDWVKEHRRFSVLTDNGVMMINGMNYRQREPSRIHLAEYLTALPCYNGCKKEVTRKRGKGKASWAVGTVFDKFESAHAKDTIHNGGDFSTLICDDGNGEIADFIAVDLERKRIVLVHAKCAYPKGVRVKDLYVVLGQAAKNVHRLWIVPSQDQINRWTTGAHNTGRSRLRFGRWSSEATNLFSSPHTQREVWIIQPALNVEYFLKQLQNSSMTDAKRLAYLIDLNAATITSGSAKFRIFGS